MLALGIVSKHGEKHENMVGRRKKDDEMKVKEWLGHRRWMRDGAQGMPNGKRMTRGGANGKGGEELTLSFCLIPLASALLARNNNLDNRRRGMSYRRRNGLFERKDG